MNWDGSIPRDDFLADWERTSVDRSFTPRLGDSSFDAGQRFAAVVHEVGAERARQVVLVTHGGVTIDGLRTLLGDVEVARLLPTWRAGLPAGGLTTLSVRHGTAELVDVGNCSHLAGLRADAPGAN